MTHHHTRAWVQGLVLALMATGTGLAGSATAAPADQPVAAQRAGTAAGTIVYISQHNVWIARGDGSGARALTTDGSFALPYVSPSQSDNGVIVAARSERLVRMNQSGKVLNVLDPPALPTSVGVAIDGKPTEAAISPDGSRIAYTFTQYLNPGGASSGFRSATGYTAAGELTDPAPLGTTYSKSPSWVGNSRTLQSGGSGHQVEIHDLGSGQAPQHWFDDGDIYMPSTDLANSELSRDGQYVTAVRGYGATSTIHWYAVNGNATSGPPPADPTPMCQIGPLEGITNPTWGPDNDSLAWEEPDGIWTRSGARDCTVPSALVLPGGSQPHWSPAALGPVDPATGPDAGQTPGPGQVDGPARSLKNTGRPRIKGKAKVGKKLTSSTGAWSLPDLSYAFTWFRNGKKISGKVGKGRSYRIVRKDRGKKLTVRVTAARGKVRRSAMSAPVKIRR